MTCVQEHMWRSMESQFPPFHFGFQESKSSHWVYVTKAFLLNHLVCLRFLHFVQSRIPTQRKVPLTLGEYLPTSINTAQKLPYSHVRRSVSRGNLDPVKSASRQTHTSPVLCIRVLGQLIPQNCTSLTCSSLLPPLPPCYHLPSVPAHLFIKISRINEIIQTFLLCLADFTKHNVFQVCFSCCKWQYLVPLQCTS